MAGRGNHNRAISVHRRGAGLAAGFAAALLAGSALAAPPDSPWASSVSNVGGPTATSGWSSETTPASKHATKAKAAPASAPATAAAPAPAPQPGAAPAGSPPTDKPQMDTSIYAKPVSTKLNPTGRAINMPVPLKDDGQPIGEIVVRINADDSVSIPKPALVEKLGPTLQGPFRQKLDQLPEQGGMVTLTALKAAGFNAKFDPGQLELNFIPNADQRPEGELSLGGYRTRGISAAALRPAIFSGYLNVYTGVDYLWGDTDRDSRASGRLDLESVFRFYNLVIENEFSWEGDVDAFTCPASAICTYEHESGFKRRRSRMIYDFVGEQIRVQVGDVDTYGAGFQRSPDLAGVTIEKTPRKLAPGEHIRPTGSSSFRIERNANVEVFINGAPVRRFQLRAGNYNLRDLPLTTGANDIELQITDESGERRTIRYTSFFEGSLLAAGKNEWSVSGGVPSFYRDNERDYRSDHYFATAFYRQGLTNDITGEINVQGDDKVVMGGVGIFSATPWGYFGLQGAVSAGDGSSGFAVNVNWALANIRGVVSGWSGLRESLSLGAEYRSTDFRAPGEFLETASGVLYAQNPYWLRLYASYSVPITQSVSLSLGARYQFADNDRELISPYTTKGDRYGFDVTVSSPITYWATAAITAGYSNESYSRTFFDRQVEPDGEFRVMGRLYIRPTENTRIAASYDTLNDQTYVSAHHGVGRGIDRWEATADVQQSGRDSRATASGSLGYYGNRGEVRVAHSTGFDGVTWDKFNAEPSDQRSTVRLGTAVAFADGAVGWGQPIRGGAFGIVTPHETIAGKEVLVGTKDDPIARADMWGPVIVPSLPSYTSSTTPVDVPDAPVGYSLGAGGFDTFAPYRAGYRMEVGSAYSVSAYGTLLKSNGEPISLLTGVAYPAGNPEKQVAIFTNGAGKFGAEGLAPGKWFIEMATEGAPTKFAIDIPKGTDGLYKAGTLKPVGR